jgi:hypothetical protein
MKRLITPQILLLVICGLSLTAKARIIRVPADQTTIQAGIDAANNGDTVLISPGTYRGSGNRDLSTSEKTILVSCPQLLYHFLS